MAEADTTLAEANLVVSTNSQESPRVDSSDDLRRDPLALRAGANPALALTLIAAALVVAKVFAVTRFDVLRTMALVGAADTGSVIVDIVASHIPNGLPLLAAVLFLWARASGYPPLISVLTGIAVLGVFLLTPWYLTLILALVAVGLELRKRRAQRRKQPEVVRGDTADADGWVLGLIGSGLLVVVTNTAVGCRLSGSSRLARNR
jgi:hypothetical protein